MSATFVDESSPPDRNTPNCTSAIIRLAIDAWRRRRSSATISPSDMPASETARLASSGSHQMSRETDPSAATVIRSAGASLLMPANIVRGGGVKANVR